MIDGGSVPPPGSRPAPRGRTFLVTGATGFIGSRFATLAQERGHSVKTLTRSDWAGAPEVPPESRYFGSLPGEIPPESVRDVDVVVHCAAEIQPHERRSLAVNVHGTIRLARMAACAGARTFVFLSTQSARPDSPSVYGRTKFAAEQELLSEDRLSVVILRPGLVTGPGGKSLFGRMCRLVENLPLIPVLGDRRSPVQPIHVDDLCEAIFRCAERARELAGSTLHLGDPVPIGLGDFLEEIARVRLARRKRSLSIPLAPVEAAVRIAERIGLPLPVTSSNLTGLRRVQTMDSREDLARLGMTLRPLPEAVRDEAGLHAREPLGRRAVRVLLIGGGRIGLVHSVTLSRMRGAVLAGVVDPKPAATSFLRGLGLSVPMYRSLEEALASEKPDGAIVATPVASHLRLARTCLAAGLAVMVEKPLAIRRTQLQEYERLAAEFPDQPISVGYVMPRNPQISSFVDDLRAGRFGRVRAFHGFSLISLIHEAKTGRWETDRKVSGGGAFINAGSHVLSMVRAAFGDPSRVAAETTILHSSDVEDSIVVTYDYPDFQGTHWCSWSIEGFPRQENTLVVWTELGTLLLTGSVGVFVREGGPMNLRHQLDFDVGFNIAPDYAGAGFSTELADFATACRTRLPPPMDLREAVEIERLLFDVYDASRDVRTFSHGAGSPAPAGGRRVIPPVRRDQAPRPPAPRRVLDLRDVSPGRLGRHLRRLLSEPDWAEVLLDPSQVRGFRADGNSERLRVTVPDFLKQSRSLSTGRYLTVVKEMRLGGVIAAILAAVPLLVGERGATFWVAAMGLLGGALDSVSPDFRGTVLLHGYMTDLALSLRRLDVLDRMLALCRRCCPSARVGFHTNMASEAANALRLLEERVDHVSILTSPEAVAMATLVAGLPEAAGNERLQRTAEVGLAPAIVHRAAFEEPGTWSFGAEWVLIGAAAEPALYSEARQDLDRHWKTAFPGLAFPDSLP